MAIRVANAQLWVHDQEEALDFWTNKVGFEVRADITMPELGDFRWLTVGAPGQEDFSIALLAIPGPPVMDEDTKKQVEELMAKGFAGSVFLTRTTCRPPTRSSRAAASSSPRRPPSSPTESTPSSATPPATSFGSASRRSS